MKKVLGIVLALILCVSMFAGCGGGGSTDSDDPNLGLYTASHGEMWDMPIDDVSEYFGNGFTVELKAGGKAALNVDGKKANGKWTLDGDAFTVSGGGFDSSGTLKNGVMTLEDVLGIGLTLVLLKEGVSADSGGGVGDSTASGGNLPAEFAWWDGAWYGFYFIYDAGGKYEDLYEDFFDAYAFIDMTSNGTGDMFFWDDWEELGTAKIQVDPNGGVNESEFGVMNPTSGTMFGLPIEDLNWIVDPGLEKVPNLIWIDAKVGDLKGQSDYIWFEFYLRPWGTLWDDMGGDVPPAYDNWYIGDGYRDIPNMMDALADTFLQNSGNPVFIHPGLPTRAWDGSSGAGSKPSGGGSSGSTDSGTQGGSSGGGGEVIVNMTYTELRAALEGFGLSREKTTYDDVAAFLGVPGEFIDDDDWYDDKNYAKWYASDNGYVTIFFDKTTGFYTSWSSSELGRP